MSADIGRGEPPQFQSEDPKKPWYRPPPLPEEKQDTTVIRTYDDWIAHPDSHDFEATMAPEEGLKIRAHIEKQEREASAQKTVHDANWKSKKPLDDVVGKNRDLKAKQACVGVVNRYQMLVSVAQQSGAPQSLIDAHTKRAVSDLSKICPDVLPAKLTKLLAHKGSELGE